MGLVDDVDAPLAAHDTAVLVALFQRLKRIDNLHAPIPRQGPEDRERAGRSQIRRVDRQVCAACDLPISSKAASATDRHECPLLIQAQRGPIYQHPPIWSVPMSPATPQPSWKDSEPSLTWVLGLRPEVFARAGAAQISGPSLPPRHDLQYPCRLLPWPAEVRVGAPFSRPRLAVKGVGLSFGIDFLCRLELLLRTPTACLARQGLGTHWRGLLSIGGQSHRTAHASRSTIGNAGISGRIS